ncbi:YbhN family protein [Marinimicrobium sp. ABcell2]|uniref:lysylphosphatidylglycerol synthase transmembrane domain-containing protein n=1 Tax=Marinimicrobium sp. ABcell2 TaxID=3069751 RepID=UPI0027B60C4B|nr:YbhN family protein [Marinimicrobium sp. ABcell2]MDQ2077873.1 YbhN family protein [Marinimicrobium sp. ABcell2]
MQNQTLAKLRKIYKKVWPYLKHVFAIGFLGLVLWLLVHHAREVDWREVFETLRNYSLWTIFLGITCALSTYLVYSSYDLFGRLYIKSRISKIRMMMIAFVSCAFTLNLGALIGSVGFRYRMYTQRGVSKTDVTRIIGVTLSTNWLGYIFLAGLVFASGSLSMPANWVISTAFLRLLGGLFLAVVLGYFILCHFAKTRSWSIRGQNIVLPTVRLATVQLVVASAHWMLMGAIMFSFLHTEVGYFELLGVLLVSAIAGIIAHIPGALGVLEAVFIALLADQVPPAMLFAALIAYRAVFYLLPLFIAVILYAGFEITAKKKQNSHA